ncbi:hypothetical protein [Flavisolibacter tropicus]|uniref:DUF916 domain-containing protein n=1 Tax=Flavisolibacter tropicus TaxID=1492898 RepID=A0A172TXW5_9BACT|nr:hypothetical protein [Flavisolibacter tropicus]ANE51951.1 hypothetical protein SY85_17085 [Flavisolibacter tropicus]
MRKKRFNKLRFYLFCLLLAGLPLALYSQEDSTAAPAEEKAEEPADPSAETSARESLVYLQYFVKNNRVPYLKVQTKTKSEEKGFQSAPKVPVSIYLDKDSVKEALVANVITDAHGESIISLPPSLAALWNEADAHSFIANAAATKDFDATTKTTEVTIAKLELDTVTTETGRSVVAHVLKKEGTSWVPMPDIELKLTAKRYGGYLNISDEETYTTDSSGKAEGEFKPVNLPGDNGGNIELVALIDDNDMVGSMQTVMKVPWGSPLHFESRFEERSLWSRGSRAPIWLIFMASACIIGVWSVIIYLFTRIYQIRKLGVEEK